MRDTVVEHFSTAVAAFGGTSVGLERCTLRDNVTSIIADDRVHLQSARERQRSGIDPPVLPARVEVWLSLPKLLSNHWSDICLRFAVA